MLRGGGICTEMYKCKARGHYVRRGAHMHTGVAQKHTHTREGKIRRQSRRPRPLRGGGRDCAYWINKRGERQSHLLPVSLLFTRSSWRVGFWFPLNKPPAGCLNRPLINPSVGSLLRAQPSEEGSNPAKHTERRLRAGEEEGSDFSFNVLSPRFRQQREGFPLMSPKNGKSIVNTKTQQ